MQVADLNVKAGVPQTFQTCKHLFAHVVPLNNISQLEAQCLEHQVYALKEIMEPYFSGECMCKASPFLHVVHWISRTLPTQKALSMFRVSNRKESAAITDSNIAKYACIY